MKDSENHTKEIAEITVRISVAKIEYFKHLRALRENWPSVREMIWDQKPKGGKAWEEFQKIGGECFVLGSSGWKDDDYLIEGSHYACGMIDLQLIVPLADWQSFTEKYSKVKSSVEEVVGKESILEFIFSKEEFAGMCLLRGIGKKIRLEEDKIVDSMCFE